MHEKINNILGNLLVVIATISSTLFSTNQNQERLLSWAFLVCSAYLLYICRVILNL